METIKATVIQIEEKWFIQIGDEDDVINIPMSEDKSNDVKKAFNRIISWIKNGKFQIELDDVREDLFSQVANEYITQLNREILEVYGEVEHYGLLVTDDA